MHRILIFLDIIVTGLIAGTVFGILMGYNPGELSAITYVEQQQNVIHGLNTLMPMLGLVAFIITVILAFHYRKITSIIAALSIAGVLLIVSGLITRFGNQPINDIVLGWNIENIPNNWQDFRDEWWRFHTIRTLTSFIAFTLVAWVASIPKTLEEDITMAV